MRRFVVPAVLLSFGLALPAAAQTAGMPAATTQTKESAITLSDDQKEAVIDAAVTAKSRQKTPDEFSPQVGATVPQKVYLHAFRPEVTQKTPLLKEYSYAFLDREVVLVGPTKKVVAVVALPQRLVDGDQPDQGAAEPSSTNAKGDDPPPPAAVPSHTSPESIK